MGTAKKTEGCDRSMSEVNVNQQSGSANGGISPRLREHLHLREAVCLELEKLPETAVEDYQSEILRLQEKFNSQPEVAPEYAEILDRRFEAALAAAQAAAETVAARKALREEKNQEAVQLRKELDALIAAGELVTLGEVEKLGKRWEECLKLADPAAVNKADFDAAYAPLKQKLEAEAEAERKNAEAAIALGEELKALLDYDDFNFIQQRKTAIENKFAELGSIPRSAFDRYNEQHRAVAAKLSQHYQTLDLARWESFTLKMDLCAELEKMQSAPENQLPQVAKSLRELRDKWKTLGSVPKEKNDEINNRYLDVSRALQHRVDEYYTKVRQEQKNAAEAKKVLCAKAVELQTSTEWNAATEAFKQLQAEWKTIAHAGNAEKSLYAAFRASADQFFAARTAYFDERNKKNEAIAEIKNKLIREAESLDLAQGEFAVRKAKQLRADYRQAGMAGRLEKDLSARFDAALEKFFAGRQAQFSEKESKVRELLSEITALTGNITDPAAAEGRVRTIRNEIAELNCRNLRSEEEKTVAAFYKALAGVRKKVLADKFTVYCELAPLAAAAADAVLNGNAAPELPEEQLALFPKLQQMTLLFSAISGGDQKALEKLKKMTLTAGTEQERIVSALEEAVGIKTAKAADTARDLAAELQAAIFGNSGFGSAEKQESKPVDPKQLLSDYFNAGVSTAEDTAASVERFKTAYAKLR